MRLIDADEFLTDELEAFISAQSKVTNKTTMLVNEVVHTKIVRLICDAPTVEPKKGEWFKLDDCANEGIYCSECRAKIFDFVHPPKKKISNFCPNCGADMRESLEN